MIPFDKKLGISVSKAVDGGRNTTTALNKLFARELVDGNNGCISEKTAKFD